MKVLVTGAAGRLGYAVCKVLHARGFDVRAVDMRYRPEMPVKLELYDARDELSAYRLVEGCDALVHLGNYTNMWAGPTFATILADNVRMNANYFFAARDLGLKKLIFASSIQVILPNEGKGPPPRAIPYLPLDGNSPRNPRANPYALSKESGERLLEVLAGSDPEMMCSAVRYPGLKNEENARWMVSSGKPVSKRWVGFAELLAHLYFEDAAELVRALLERETPGYHSYFPAVMPDLINYPLPELIRDEYPDVPLRKPLEEITSLIDIEPLEQKLGWRPERRMSYELDRAKPSVYPS